MILVIVEVAVQKKSITAVGQTIITMVLKAKLVTM
jgi:hypothetical protein